MSDFTLRRYAELLAIAREEGYEFVGFADLGEAPGEAIVLRHDIDFSPRWLAPMAAAEQAHGVRSTWCLQPSATTYRWDGPQTRAAIGALLEAGHELALHFDANRCATEVEIVEGVLAEAAALERVYGVAVRVVSFHQVGRRMLSDLELPAPLINTYAPRFFTDIGYVSDSNMHWRGKDLEALLRSHTHRLLQVLIHPVWWRAEAVSLRQAIQDVADESGMPFDAIVSPEQLALIEAAS
jgi:hypothetical protein